MRGDLKGSLIDSFFSARSGTLASTFSLLLYLECLVESFEEMDGHVASNGSASITALGATVWFDL